MLNKIVLQGRLTKDPEYSTSQNGNTLCRFSIATERDFKNKQTGKRDVDFINCSAYGRTADFINQYFAKGNPITVEGSLRNNNYTDKSGIKHYSDTVAVNSAYFNIGSNNKTMPQQPSQAAAQKSNAENIDMENLGEYEDAPF